MTFASWASENIAPWVVMKIDLPNRRVFRDSYFGPYWHTLPDEVVLAEEEKALKMDGAGECGRYLEAAMDEQLEET